LRAAVRPICFAPGLTPGTAREITADDIVYAFERIGTESLVAQYGFYYDVIEGMAEFKSGDAETISGVTAVDDKTIEFTLTAPTGDFLYRLGMPAAAPVPREVASCFTEAAAGNQAKPAAAAAAAAAVPPKATEKK
jgi:ABC-type oligopeptide transport system substrate-binding subunit